jgi:hypothetical protein
LRQVARPVVVAQVAQVARVARSTCCNQANQIDPTNHNLTSNLTEPDPTRRNLTKPDETP